MHAALGACRQVDTELPLLMVHPAPSPPRCSCRRYGLIGPNGCGKSSLLKALGNREVPIPDHVDTYHLDREMEASDLTALEAVMKVSPRGQHRGSQRRH